MAQRSLYTHARGCCEQQWTVVGQSVLRVGTKPACLMRACVCVTCKMELATATAMEMERIVDHQVKEQGQGQGQGQEEYLYLIKWKGFSHASNSVRLSPSTCHALGTCLSVRCRHRAGQRAMPAVQCKSLPIVT